MPPAASRWGSSRSRTSCSLASAASSWCTPRRSCRRGSPRRTARRRRCAAAAAAAVATAAAAARRRRRRACVVHVLRSIPQARPASASPFPHCAQVGPLLVFVMFLLAALELALASRTPCVVPWLGRACVNAFVETRAPWGARCEYVCLRVRRRRALANAFVETRACIAVENCASCAARCDFGSLLRVLRPITIFRRRAGLCSRLRLWYVCILHYLTFRMVLFDATRVIASHRVICLGLMMQPWRLLRCGFGGCYDVVLAAVVRVA